MAYRYRGPRGPRGLSGIGVGSGELTDETVTWAPTASPNVKALSIHKGVETANATPLVALSLAHDDETAVDYEATVLARCADGRHALFDLRATYSRTGGTFATVRTATSTDMTTGSAPAGWAAAFSAASGLVKLTVKGEASKQIRWSILAGSQALGLPAVIAPAPAVPAGWALKGYWKAPFTASPWVGSASAGDSNTRNLTEATNPPAVGTSNSADFDGTNDLLTAAGTVGSYYTATAYSGYALVWIDAISSDSNSTYLNDPIVCDAAGYVGVFLKATGPTVSVYHNGTDVEGVASKTFATGAWQLIQWRYNGTNIGVRVNSGTWNTMACAGLAGGLGGTMLVGKSTFVPNWLDGKIRDMGLINVAKSDAEFDALVAGINATYGLSL